MRSQWKPSRVAINQVTVVDTRVLTFDLDFWSPSSYGHHPYTQKSRSKFRWYKRQSGNRQTGGQTDMTECTISLTRPVNILAAQAASKQPRVGCRDDRREMGFYIFQSLSFPYSQFPFIPIPKFKYYSHFHGIPIGYSPFHPIHKHAAKQ